MEIEAITFDSKNDKIIVITQDGNAKEYTRDQAQQYIDDTGRVEDVIAMGWEF